MSGFRCTLLPDIVRCAKSSERASAFEAEGRAVEGPSLDARSEPDKGLGQTPKAEIDWSGSLLLRRRPVDSDVLSELIGPFVDVGHGDVVADFDELGEHGRLAIVLERKVLVRSRHLP